MPPATDALAEAFSDSLTVHGESLSFRKGKVVALVNRSPKPDKIPNQVKLDYHSASQISTPATIVPEAGEYFYDSASYRHRVENVQFLGACYLCTCFVSKVK